MEPLIFYQINKPSYFFGKLVLTFLTHPSIPPASGGASTEEELGMGIHGGLRETSVFAYLRPGQVDMDRAVRRVPEWLADNTWVRFGGAVQFGWTSRDFGPDGHIGDPTGANPELGKELFEQSVTVLADKLREISRFDYPGCGSWGPGAHRGMMRAWT